jgi:alpha-beta hydrolase superfamily lysophospholipase
MFFYFPNNYMWSLAVNRCLAGGGHFGEIHWALRDLAHASDVSPQGDNEQWRIAWEWLAAQTEATGHSAREGGHAQTAAAQLYRAAQYYQWAEAFLDPDDPRAAGLYAKHLSCFGEFATLTSAAVEMADVPFGNAALAAYFVKGAANDPKMKRGERKPTVILWDGLDGTKEEMFPMAARLAERGINCLGIDITGQGASLRLHGLTARHDTEVCAAAAIDHLLRRNDVDPERIGLIGASMGGYSAPRAAVYEKRIKACVAWGAIYDYHDVWVRRLRIAGGKASVNYSSEARLESTSLKSLARATSTRPSLSSRPLTFVRARQRSNATYCFVHGEDDRQTSLENAKMLFDAIGSKRKELRVYTKEEGGASHVQLDRQEPAASLIADWFVDHL